MKRIFGGTSYANVTATIALIVALGGTSYAAIKLPKNSVTSATVKDRSLLKKDFKTGQLPAGKTGKQGPPGPAGTAGGSGAAGGAGTGVGLFNRAEAVENLVPGSADQPIQSLALPAGNWVVTAKFIAENSTPKRHAGLQPEHRRGGGRQPRPRHRDRLRPGLERQHADRRGHARIRGRGDGRLQHEQQRDGGHISRPQHDRRAGLLGGRRLTRGQQR